MTRGRTAMTTLLLVAALVGCGQQPVAAPDTLAPLSPAGGQPVLGEPLQASEPPATTSTVDRDVAGDHVIQGLQQYPTMMWLLSASGVLAEIGRRPVTILAPSELAFRDFAVTDLYGLMSNPKAFAPILRRHVLVGVYDPAALAAAGTVTNLAGEQLAVWRNGASVVVDDVTLSPPTTEADAGSMVYGADRVLLSTVGSG
jgi:uncharacterized surface protein with fasciclin (FAS1) repeats